MGTEWWQSNPVRACWLLVLQMTVHRQSGQSTTTSGARSGPSQLHAIAKRLSLDMRLLRRDVFVPYL